MNNKTSRFKSAILNILFEYPRYIEYPETFYTNITVEKYLETDDENILNCTKKTLI